MPSMNPTPLHAPVTASVNPKKDTPRDSEFVVTGDRKEINWVHTYMLVVPPTLAIIGIFTTPLNWRTMIFGTLLYFWAGLGITAGYHRLWSHRAYSAKWIVRLMLLLGGAAAFEGSAKWWCRNHRAHHRYTDTEKDPYNARKGFFYAHLGWMLVKQNVKQIGYADISDLNRDPMVLWQHKYYPWISISVGVVFPVLVSALWGDPWGGFFFAVMSRIVFVHHATFFVNSLAHYLGDHSFSDHHTAVDSYVTAVLTLGEGYHNYHHEFPQDYRNGIRFYHYDPTKWLITSLSFFNLTYNLKYISNEEIQKANLQMKQRVLDSEKAKFAFGKQFEHLPELTWDGIKEKISNGQLLVVIDKIVYDVTAFVHTHPGGRQTLLNYVGTDASDLFYGLQTPIGLSDKHKHSDQAKKYMIDMRIGHLRQNDMGA